MVNKFKFISIANMHHLIEGLSFKISNCAEAMDAALHSFDLSTGIPSKIVSWNRNKNDLSNFPSFNLDGRLVLTVEQRIGKQGKLSVFSSILVSKEDKETSPIAFFIMKSFTLDIPMRLEVPLRALIKGGHELKGTHLVYLHTILTDSGDNFPYYGITKRGWNIRFLEHVRATARNSSRRLFPKKLHELVDAKKEEISSGSTDKPKIEGLITSLCAIGLDEKQAMDTEEYLVDKYSLSSKHKNGLNMIPGGYEGIRSLHRLSILKDRIPVETERREELLDNYLKSHPQLGVPKPGVAEKWNNPEYAEAVICGRENRLGADQVRQIRYLSALGKPVGEIVTIVGAINCEQVERVLEGRTYTRIQ